MVAVLAAVSVAGELVLPTHGAVGFLLRGLAWCLIWPLLRAVGFFHGGEIRHRFALIASIVRARGRTSP